MTSRCEAQRYTAEPASVPQSITTRLARIALTADSATLPPTCITTTFILSAASKKTDSIVSIGGTLPHHTSPHSSAQKLLNEVTPSSGIVDSRPLLTPNHKPKEEQARNYGAAKPVLRRKRKKKTARITTGGLSPRAALANGVLTGKGEGNGKGLTDVAKHIQ
jgi:hypothetical protein